MNPRWSYPHSGFRDRPVQPLQHLSAPSSILKHAVPLSNVETLTYVVAAAIAILVAVLASLAPARRAASVLPMVAMRSE